ncbi:MAG TPA: hypothetical protein VF150_12305, partial [Thermoanaerobaculia bacterium]
CFALDHLRQNYLLIGGVDIYSDPEANEWTFCHEGVTYFYRETQGGAHWHSPHAVQALSLIAIADEVFLCPESELGIQDLWQSQRAQAEQILTLGETQGGSALRGDHLRWLKR